MKEILKMLVQAVHVLSFCGVILSGVLGAVYEIIGHADLNRYCPQSVFRKDLNRFGVLVQ